ncbi:hypothetical protein EJ03DRAFT_326256 [Teratosphaeria nubilosa]|uniref:Copper homeostasis protein cutC homolog n=1 Tax=Teratosphaeria nubilosa TaxID=161662 RepID=A0A6G1LCG9_9PEZI|nr:hypothetical protein EJ03DRAFT_326256 [Teratosphaeria nubilosa]
MPADNALLEIACFSPDHALLAHKAGADRLELCKDRNAGGISPSLEWLQKVKAEFTIPVFVMVRPRGGDFNYTADEFEQMRMSLEAFDPYADGYVFGVLDVYRRVDMKRTAELVRLARGKPCTFHRACDETPNLFEALEDVVKAGCKAILTSGGAPTAQAGSEAIRQLVQLARGRVEIIVGGGVRSHNLGLLRKDTQARVFHSAAIEAGMEMPTEQEVALLKRAVQG